MSAGRFTAPGKTRSCPHCRATILDSATICPGCHHHLRFDSAQRAQSAETPLRVDGILRHASDGGAWEYSIVLAIRNGRGEEISRQVVGVGAIQPAEERTFTLAVEVFKPAEIRVATPQTAGTAPRPTDPGAAAAPVPGRMIVPPGPAREPMRPPAAAARDPRVPLNGSIPPQPRSSGFKDPRVTASDPKLYPKRS